MAEILCVYDNHWIFGFCDSAKDRLFAFQSLQSQTNQIEKAFGLLRNSQHDSKKEGVQPNLWISATSQLAVPRHIIALILHAYRLPVYWVGSELSCMPPHQERRPRHNDDLNI